MNAQRMLLNHQTRRHSPSSPAEGDLHAFRARVGVVPHLHEIVEEVAISGMQTGASEFCVRRTHAAIHLGNEDAEFSRLYNDEVTVREIF